MPWQEITFELGADQAELFEQALMESGALSLTLRDAEDQPIMEPAPQTTPLWDHVLLTAMFEVEVDATVVVASLKQQLALDKIPVYRVEILEDREWRRTWMEHFQPMCFGQRLWICPSGYERPGQADAVVIDLDPGLAFGTGSHPTTSLCMKWLDANPPIDLLVIDYGCGSGVLAIAAAKLGADRVIAIDNDPQALQATRENAAANGVESMVQTYMPDNVPEDVQADVIMANILLEPLMSLKDTFREMMKQQGKLILSGLLDNQVSQLQAAYDQDFIFQTCEQLEDWVRLEAELNQ